MTSDRKVGRIDSRSMTPKKLRAYFAGRRTHSSRSAYSAVNSSVKNHSATRSAPP